MKKTFLIIALLFSWSILAPHAVAENPTSGETPPILPTEEDQSHNPPVLGDTGAGNSSSSGSGTTSGSGSMNTCAELEPGSEAYNDCVIGSGGNPSLPGMPGGGTQNTGALNGETPPDTTAGVGAPQSGASQLQQCSKIRFLSLLDILIWIKCIIVVAVIPLIFALALAVFLWGVMKFIATSDPAKRKEGKNFIVGGLIGLFVMTSLWGIIKIVSNTLGTGSAVPILQTSSLKKTN